MYPVITIIIKRKILPVIGTSEAILRTSPLRTMNWILVTIVAAIIIAIAEPVGLHTDVRLLAFQMIQRACSVSRASFMRLIGCDVVFTIINTVAHLRLRDAAMVGASEFSRCARWVNAAFFIATVPTVVFVVALPGFKDASAVVATELVRAARMIS